MARLIVDSSVFIDLAVAGILTRLFRLEDRILTTDIIFDRELAARRSDFPQHGLEVVEMEPDDVIATSQRMREFPGTSFPDQSVLTLAVRQGGVVLANDRLLREAARATSLEIHGTLWVVERMIRARQMSVADATVAYARMEEAGSRLPFGQAHERLRRLQHR